MKPATVATFLVLLVGTISAQVARRSEKPRPTFSDYPANDIYQGTRVAPKLTTKNDRLFRTMIRKGASAKTQFAGHYTVPIWGCGSSCVDFVIVDSTTGRVYDPPFSVVVGFPGAWMEEHVNEQEERIEFRADSRVLKINGCPNERDCGFYDYLMTDGEGLKLLRKELLPKQYQP